MVYRCIEPNCPTDCVQDQCRCAIPGEDKPRVLVADLLDYINELHEHYGRGGPSEDGEVAVIDRARAFLCDHNSPN